MVLIVCSQFCVFVVVNERFLPALLIDLDVPWDCKSDPLHHSISQTISFPFNHPERNNANENASIQLMKLPLGYRYEYLWSPQTCISTIDQWNCKNRVYWLYSHLVVSQEVLVLLALILWISFVCDCRLRVLQDIHRYTQVAAKEIYFILFYN